MPFQELSDAQQTFLKESAPTIWHIIPTFEFLLQCWETMAAHSQHRKLKSALNEGVKSLCKWHARVEGACGTYFICLGMFLSSVISQFLLVANYSALVLDPNVKDLYFRARWDSVRYNAGMKELGEVVCQISDCSRMISDFCLISLTAILSHQL